MSCVRGAAGGWGSVALPPASCRQARASVRSNPTELTPLGTTTSRLYVVNLRASMKIDAGSAIPIGEIGGGEIVRDIAVAPQGTFQQGSGVRRAERLGTLPPGPPRPSCLMKEDA